MAAFRGERVIAVTMLLRTELIRAEVKIDGASSQYSLIRSGRI